MVFLILLWISYIAQIWTILLVVYILYIVVYFLFICIYLISNSYSVETWALLYHIFHTFLTVFYALIIECGCDTNFTRNGYYITEMERGNSTCRCNKILDVFFLLEGTQPNNASRKNNVGSDVVTYVEPTESLLLAEI